MFFSLASTFPWKITSVIRAYSEWTVLFISNPQNFCDKNLPNLFRSHEDGSIFRPFGPLCIRLSLIRALRDVAECCKPLKLAHNFNSSRLASSSPRESKRIRDFLLNFIGLQSERREQLEGLVMIRKRKPATHLNRPPKLVTRPRELKRRSQFLNRFDLGN